MVHDDDEGLNLIVTQPPRVHLLIFLQGASLVSHGICHFNSVITLFSLLSKHLALPMVGFRNVSRQWLFGLGIIFVAQSSVELPNMWDDSIVVQ